MIRDIGILIYPDFQLLDAAGPASVFETAGHLAADGSAYRVALISPSGGLVRSSGGLAVQSIASRDAPVLDSLVVAGGQGARAADLDPSVHEFVRSQATVCRRIASVCTGTFILAEAGVADGRQVTTHWQWSSLLARHYPRLTVTADRIWVQDGSVWSSAGVTAGIDLALALVADDFGDSVADRTARQLVVYYKRPGGQSQFSTIEELGGRDHRFRPVLAWIREHLDGDLGVEDLAQVAAMSPRNFSRQFLRSTGRTPARAVQQIRVEEARRLVEGTDIALARIAGLCGFSDAEIMRRAFLRIFGQAPRALRTRTRTRASSTG